MLEGHIAIVYILLRGVAQYGASPHLFVCLFLKGLILKGPYKTQTREPYQPLKDQYHYSQLYKNNKSHI